MGVSSVMRRRRSKPNYKGQYTHVFAGVEITEEQADVVRAYSQQNNNLKDPEVIRAFIEIYGSLIKIVGGQN